VRRCRAEEYFFQRQIFSEFVDAGVAMLALGAAGRALRSPPTDDFIERKQTIANSLQDFLKFR
jgi:hypothetical protein